MELLAGQTLAETIRERGPMPSAAVIHIAAQIARALSAAHAEGIVHRDLKPDNVMLLNQYGEHDFVKVLDFGIARVLDLGEAATQLTDDGSIIGTPAYMAPEQAMAQAVDHRADLYALGVVMYHMIAGKVPFSDPTPVRVLLMHVQEAPPPLADDIAARVHPTLLSLILLLLAKDPDQRPQSAAEVFKILANCASDTIDDSKVPTGPGIAILPPQPIKRDKWFAQVRRTHALQALSAVAVLGLWIFATRGQPQHAAHVAKAPIVQAMAIVPPPAPTFPEPVVTPPLEPVTAPNRAPEIVWPKASTGATTLNGKPVTLAVDPPFMHISGLTLSPLPGTRKTIVYGWVTNRSDAPWIAWIRLKLLDAQGVQLLVFQGGLPDAQMVPAGARRVFRVDIEKPLPPTLAAFRLETSGMAPDESVVKDRFDALQVRAATVRKDWAGEKVTGTVRNVGSKPVKFAYVGAAIFDREDRVLSYTSRTLMDGIDPNDQVAFEALAPDDTAARAGARVEAFAWVTLW